MTRIVFALAAVGLLVAGVAWAVSLGSLPPADLTFSNESEIKTVDPALVTGQPEGRIIRALFEGLVNLDPRTLEPIPGVAERWEISEDGLVYTFHLRDEARWSDGTPVTADDFHWSMRRFLHPETASQYSYQLWYVVGGRRYSTLEVAVGDRVEIELEEKPPGALPFAAGRLLHGRLVAIDPAEGSRPTTYHVEIDGRIRRFRKPGGPPDPRDDPAAAAVEPYRWLLLDFDEVGIRRLDAHTLRIELDYPTPYFLQLVAFYPLFPVQPRCVETFGYPRWTKPEHIVSNGPYRLHSRRIRDRIRLVRSETYWNRQAIPLEVIDALAIESNTTALNLYLTGQIDWTPQVPATVVPELLAQERDDFRPAPYLGTYYYRLNTRRPGLDDPRVRRALNLALDKREIVEKVTRAGQIPARSLVPSAIRDYMPYDAPQCEAYDPIAAQRLLAEAGYPGGRGLPTMEILYNTHETHKSIAELIQSQWKRTLGIDVRLQNQEWAVYLSRQRNGEYWIARAAWIGDYVDPNTFLDMFVTDGANNQTGWGSPQYDAYLEAARREPDSARRLAELAAAEAILMEELPIIPIYFYVTTSMVRPYVRGYYRNITDTHPFLGIDIDLEQKAEVLGRGRL